MIPYTTTVAWKLGQKAEPWRRKSNFENGQTTYEVPLSIQDGQWVDQI
jgi:hypothetical protein